VEEEEGKRLDSRGQETGISRGTLVSDSSIIFPSNTSHLQSTRDNAPPNCAHRNAATPGARWDGGGGRVCSDTSGYVFSKIFSRHSPKSPDSIVSEDVAVGETLDSRGNLKALHHECT